VRWRQRRERERERDRKRGCHGRRKIKGKGPLRECVVIGKTDI